MMDAEQRFLHSREARTNRKDTASKALHVQVAQFLAESKKRISEWSQRVEQADQQEDPQQFLLECKQKLRLWEQHCLGTTAVNGLEGWEVPMELPAADWKWLHGSFADGWALWERIYGQVVPKGKFTFVRYRQELARRRALGMPLTQSAPDSNHASLLPLTKATTETLVDPQSCLEDLENGTMDIVDNDTPQDTLPTTPASIQYHTMSSSVLLFRRLKNCTITIHKPLQALHIVESSDTTIHVKAPIASSIHITSCQGCSVYTVDVQQVRIHTTNKLHCYLKELRAGAILEASTQISFYGISESIVRDFDWLRSTPSPNFACQKSIPIIETPPDTLSTDTPTSITIDKDPVIAETISTNLPSVTDPPETTTPTVPIVEESNDNAEDDDDDDEEDDEL
eukprot:Nitzschia sp. Nitz4//scaffold92_size79448//38546//39864//NITZ4_005391-RA/size79448-snap-gene-0.130-mRNA-1//-1//CDS//3329560186//4221//frame0